MSPSRSRITIRFVIAIALAVGFVYWFSRNSPEPQPARIGLTIGVLLYAVVGYILRPKKYRYTSSRRRSLTSRRRRREVDSLRWILLPGKHLAISVIDFIWMLFGKTPDHGRFTVTLEE